MMGEHALPLLLFGDDTLAVPPAPLVLVDIGVAGSPAADRVRARLPGPAAAALLGPGGHVFVAVFAAAGVASGRVCVHPWVYDAARRRQSSSISLENAVTRVREGAFSVANMDALSCRGLGLVVVADGRNDVEDCTTFAVGSALKYGVFLSTVASVVEAPPRTAAILNIVVVDAELCRAVSAIVQSSSCSSISDLCTALRGVDAPLAALLSSVAEDGGGSGDASVAVTAAAAAESAAAAAAAVAAAGATTTNTTTTTTTTAAVPAADAAAPAAPVPGEALRAPVDASLVESVVELARVPSSLEDRAHVCRAARLALLARARAPGSAVHVVVSCSWQWRRRPQHRARSSAVPSKLKRQPLRLFPSRTCQYQYVQVASNTSLTNILFLI
jgi:hypothetical protein